MPTRSKCATRPPPTAPCAACRSRRTWSGRCCSLLLRTATSSPARRSWSMAGPACIESTHLRAIMCTGLRAESGTWARSTWSSKRRGSSHRPSASCCWSRPMGPLCRPGSLARLSRSTLHDTVAPGTPLKIAPPRNDFPLHYHDADRVLVAGGIGIAPIYAMVRMLVRRGIAFQLHYAGPDRAEMAYCPELERLCGDKVHFHYEGGRLDLDEVFDALGYPAEVYLCGQRPMNHALNNSALEHGLSRMQILQQCFDPPPPPPVNEDVGFEVELRQSGITAYVAPDTSILETLLAAGYPARFYCGRGECGFCPLPVLEADGPIEHRDHFLNAEEKGEQLCVCVSRLKGTRLVLDA